MIKHTLGITLIAAIISLCTYAHGQTLLSGKEKERAVNKICGEYNDWGVMELNGKLSIPGLPVKPSLKIYMQKDKSVILSARAPFVGEAARLEADTDSILIAYKLKRIYCKLPTEELAQKSGLTLSDIQSLLLGRVFIAGKGTLGKRNASEVDIFSMDGGEMLVMPKKSSEFYDYGFNISAEGKLADIMLTSEFIEGEAMAEYDFTGSDTRLDIRILLPSKTLGGTLSYGAPRQGALAPAPFEPGDGYRRVDASDFIKQLR